MIRSDKENTSRNQDYILLFNIKLLNFLSYISFLKFFSQTKYNLMKTDKIFFAKLSVSTLIISSLLVLFSCKETEEPVGPLVGTWTLTKEVSSNCDDPDWNEEITLNCAADVDECIKVTFTQDNKVTVALGDGSISLNGTYSISGDQLTTTIGGDSDVVNFRVSGNTLTLTYDDEDCDFTQTYIKS